MHLVACERSEKTPSYHYLSSSLLFFSTATAPCCAPSAKYCTGITVLSVTILSCLNKAITKVCIYVCNEDPCLKAQKPFN